MLGVYCLQMYVTLYDSNVHPGVNMLLGMGKLVGSNDQTAIAAAGIEIQDWAQGASDRIVQLVTEVSLRTLCKPVCTRSELRTILL